MSFVNSNKLSIFNISIKLSLIFFKLVVFVSFFLVFKFSAFLHNQRFQEFVWDWLLQSKCKANYRKFTKCVLVRYWADRQRLYDLAFWFTSNRCNKNKKNFITAFFYVSSRVNAKEAFKIWTGQQFKLISFSNWNSSWGLLLHIVFVCLVETSLKEKYLYKKVFFWERVCIF